MNATHGKLIKQNHTLIAEAAKLNTKKIINL